MTNNTVALEKGLQVQFAQGLRSILASGYREDMKPLYLETKSTNNSEKYGWMGDVPTVREWLGDKEAADLQDYEFEIKNVPFYSAIAIHKHELADDSGGIIKPRIDMLAQAVMNHKADLVEQLIENGTTGTAYDGSAFFANRTTNDNLLDGSGVTLSDLQTDLFTVRSTMMQFESDQGRILGIVPDTVVVHPDLEGTMLQAIHSNLAGASGEEVHNPLHNWITRVIAIPGLSDSNDWYAFNTSMAVRPFVYQMREHPTAVLDDTEVKRNGKYTFSAEMRGNVGYGLPQLAIKVVNS
jgi:phage major head subunit gpT-like protein